MKKREIFLSLLLFLTSMVSSLYLFTLKGTVANTSEFISSPAFSRSDSDLVTSYLIEFIRMFTMG